MRPRTSRAIAALLLAACTSDAPAPADGEPDAPRYGGTLVIGAPADISDISPLTFQVQNALYMGMYVYLTPLLRYDADFRPEPRLARSWELNEDSTQLTFHLRDDVRWHDGEPVTAEDVEFSYRRAKDPETAYTYVGLFDYYGESEVVDPSTWRVRIQPHADYLAVWRSFPPVPKHILEGTPSKDLRTHPFATTSPVGNGPFRFVERRPGDRWVFEANPDFPEELGGRPYVDRFVYRVIPETTSLLTELITGGIDYYPLLPPDQAQTVESTPGLHIVAAPGVGWMHIVWNTRRPPFDDVRVRRAMTRAIDREELITVLRGGYGRLSNASISPVFPQYDSTAGQDLTYDPDAAKALLAEVGYADRNGDGRLEDANGDPFRFTLTVRQASSEGSGLATMVQSYLQAIGVQMEIRTMEFNVMVGRLRELDAAVVIWKPEFRIDDSAMFSCAQLDGPFASGWCEPSMDALMDSIARTMDTAAAKPLWSRYQHRLADAQPMAFLYFQDDLHAVGPRLRNVHPDARGDWVGMEDWWLAR